MKKKILLIASAVVVIAAICVIGYTLAYFTDTDTAENTFTVGNVKITLDEAPVVKDEEGYGWTANDEAERVQKNTYENVYPGAILPKDPMVTNTGANDAYVRVSVTVNNASAWIAACEKWGIDDLTTIFGGFVEEDWILAGDPVSDAAEDTLTYTYYYIDILEVDASTSKLFTTVTIPADFDGDDMAAIGGEDGSIVLGIFAEAIQAAGFTADDSTTPPTPAYVKAFEAFDAQP